jgi:glycosyltransferase involved in cell wall biosynthesis
MKRVLMYDPYHDCEFGAQRCMITLAEGLKEHGYEPIIATGKEGALSRSARKAGLTVDIIPIPRSLDIFGGAALAASAPRKLFLMLEVMRYGARVSRHARRHGVDLLFANELRSCLFLLASKLRLGKPLVWGIHGGPSQGMLSAFASSVSDRVMLISRAAAKAMPPRARRRAEPKTMLNYMGIDASRYHARTSPEARSATRRRFGLPEDAVLVTTAGSISRRKGYDTLLSALELVAGDGPRVHLAVAGAMAPGGDPEYVAGLHRHVAEKGLPVTFVGWLDDLPELLAASDIFALVSREEGLGIVTLEAMATSLPVIVTYAGGSEETVVDGESGLIIHPDDPAALADRLRMLIRDPGLRSRLGERARQRCEEVFSVSAYKARFFDLVRDA